MSCKKQLLKIYKQYKLICNNTINYGDCYGGFICEGKCLHKNIWCNECRLMICGCCYHSIKFKNVCPSCQKNICKCKECANNLTQ